MSGQPVNTQSDINKYRNEYMENLDLAEEINDMNLQANKNYLLTGQLPTVSQMLDTRTTTEKLEDVQKLKKDIVEKMSVITEPPVAYAIINKVISNPLNVNNSLFRFFSQRAGEISNELKNLYPYGIVYETNDIDQIVLFIQNMYSENQGRIQSVRSFMSSSSSSVPGSNVVNSDNLSQLSVQLQNIYRNFKTIRVPYEMGVKMGELVNIVENIVYSMPATNELAILNRIMTGIYTPGIIAENPGAFGINYQGQPVPGQPAVAGIAHQRQFTPDVMQHIKPYFRLIEKLPKYSAVMTLINKLDKYLLIFMDDMNNVDAKKNIGDCLDGLLNLFSAFRDQEAINIYVSFRDIIKPILREARHIEDGREEAWDKLSSYENKIRQYGNSQVPLTNEQEQQVIYLQGQKDALKDDIARKYGEGISQKKRRGRPRGAGIIKVEKPPNYIGFGINEINRKKMNEKNILTIRRNNSRTNIPDLPSRHISDGFKNVLNTIVGGGIPKFNDMSKLTEEEQEYLYKLVNKSNLEDKLSVPAPSKDSLDRDFHEFEKMKGQIMSGNDSRELIKKFKGLIMKLSRNGYLPKNEVNDLLELLTSLSY
jgi:hypothetical protein